MPPHEILLSILITAGGIPYLLAKAYDSDFNGISCGEGCANDFEIVRSDRVDHFGDAEQITYGSRRRARQYNNIVVQYDIDNVDILNHEVTTPPTESDWDKIRYRWDKYVVGFWKWLGSSIWTVLHPVAAALKHTFKTITNKQEKTT